MGLELEKEFARAFSDTTRGNCFKLGQSRFGLNIRKKFSTVRVVQRNCACPVPGCVQGQVGRSFEQPVLAAGAPSHGRGAGTGYSFRSFPTQTIL